MPVPHYEDITNITTALMRLREIASINKVPINIQIDEDYIHVNVGFGAPYVKSRSYYLQDIFRYFQKKDTIYEFIESAAKEIYELHDYKIPNEKYPQCQEIDSALGGFFVKGHYYYLHEVCGNIQIFREDKNIRLEPVQIVFRNSLIDVQLKDPNITLYFSLRDNLEMHLLNYELYRICQNL